MRLINVSSRQLEEFYDADVPPYAILSHTWDSDEVTYEDLINGRGRDREAYRKIRFLCTQAYADGLKWAWMDTCCINKDSSAELSEAINSMFRWYRRAECCYAYLTDVPQEVFWLNERNHSTGSYSVAQWVHGSRWLRRGWCLQELIAPAQVKFYGRGWNDLGSRDMLANIIARATGIREQVLLNPQVEIPKCSVAEKMSWAAYRQTSRLEDTAYCLLGIFEVNMPMLYGEGERAFLRLQEEIIKATDDHSIFVWQPRTVDERHLLLAPTPSCFANGAMMVTIPSLHHVEGHSLGNTGLRIALPIIAVQDRPDCFHAILGCRYRDDYQNVIALCLQRRSDGIFASSQSLQPSSSIPNMLSFKDKSMAATLPSAFFVAPTVAREQRYVVERAPRQVSNFSEWPTFMITRALPVAEAEELSAGAKYWFDLKDSDNSDSDKFSIVAAYPQECFNSQTLVMNLGSYSVQYAAVLLSVSEDLARASGAPESTWKSQSLAVVFGSWTAPGKEYDPTKDSMGIFGVVQSNRKNLSNACRLAVSRSIYRSVDSSQQHVAWVRSTYSVPWNEGYYLDIEFSGDRKLGVLSEIVNIISLKLHTTRGLAKTTPMPVYQQAGETESNSLGVERLQDVVLSQDEWEMDDRRVSADMPRPDMVYELEDDSWRVHAPEPEKHGVNNYERFMIESAE